MLDFCYEEKTIKMTNPKIDFYLLGKPKSQFPKKLGLHVQSFSTKIARKEW